MLDYARPFFREEVQLKKKKTHEHRKISCDIGFHVTLS